VTPRFYVDAPLRAGGVCALPEDAGHHAVHVLRIRSGDEVTLFNGRGGEYACRVASVQKLKISVDILNHRAIEREAPLRMVLVQGVSSGERMDLTIRKAVELGVAEVRPVLAATSIARPKGERAVARREHWQRIAISACEQCGRNRIPEIHAVVSAQELKAGEASKILLSPRAELRFSDACRNVKEAVTIAAGPEAGFNAAEEAAFLDLGFVPAKLGARVLRTETAALAALAALSALRGDF
jgi:16S rRNA (uracil1498-N3)-methyltransferase